MQAHWLFVGTYTEEGGSEGVYRLAFDPSSAKFGAAELVARTDNPSFLAEGNDALFVVNENQGEDGAVSAYHLNARDGTLDLLNRLESGGSLPCHIAYDSTSNAVYLANYGSGSVAAFSLAADGSISERTALRQHAGKGPNLRRQEGPHAHSTAVAPTGTYLFAPDLGADTLFAYRQGRELLPAPDLDVACPPGCGPRHLVFNRAGSHAYLITELSNEILTFTYRCETGELALQSQTSTLPEGFSDSSFCADIHLSHDETYLYGSNRGHDSIAVFRIDPATGIPAAAGYVKTGGRHPRNFALHPSGDFLLVANCDSDQITCFRMVNGSTMEKTDETFGILKPVCLLFVDAVASE